MKNNLETSPDEKACLTAEIEVPQVEKVMISFKIPYVNYIGKSPDLTTFSASETSISAVRQVFSSGFVSKLFFKSYSHRLSTLGGRSFKNVQMYDIETQILQLFDSRSIFASDRTDASCTLTKTTLRSVFHEEHVSELCFQEEEAESVAKDEFSPHTSEHRYPGMIIMTERTPTVTLRAMFHTRRNLRCSAFQKCLPT